MSEYNISKFILVCWKLQSLPSVAKSNHSLLSRIAGNSILNKLREEAEVLTPCRRLLLVTILTPQQAKKLSAFYDNKSLLPPSQQPTICSYPGPYEYSPRPPIQFLKTHTLLPVAPRFSRWFFTEGFRAKLPLDLRISPLPQQGPSHPPWLITRIFGDT